MPSALKAEPLLTFSFHKILAQGDGQNDDDLCKMWNCKLSLSPLTPVFTKCKENLEQGRRLENISWRLWHRSTCSFSSVEVEKKRKKQPTPQNNNLASVFTTLPESLSAYRPKTLLQESLPTNMLLQTYETGTRDLPVDRESSLVPSTLPTTSAVPYLHEPVRFLKECIQPHQIRMDMHQSNLLPNNKQSIAKKSIRKPKLNFYDQFTQQQSLPLKQSNTVATLCGQESYASEQPEVFDEEDEEFLTSSSDEEEEEYEEEGDLAISPESYSVYVARQEKQKVMFNKQVNNKIATKPFMYMQDSIRNVSALTIGLGLIKQLPSEPPIEAPPQETRKGSLNDYFANQTTQQKRSIALQAKFTRLNDTSHCPLSTSIFDRSMMHENHW